MDAFYAEGDQTDEPWLVLAMPDFKLEAELADLLVDPLEDDTSSGRAQSDDGRPRVFIVHDKGSLEGLDVRPGSRGIVAVMSKNDVVDFFDDSKSQGREAHPPRAASSTSSAMEFHAGARPEPETTWQSPNPPSP